MQTAINKIKSIIELAKITDKNKKEGKKIILCHGVFDLIHPGHIRHFKQAKEHGDVLVVSITADKYVNKGPGRPIFRQDLRAEVLSSLDSVDYVTIISAESAEPVIRRLKPDFYLKGPDYKFRKKIEGVPQKLLAEEKAVNKYGGKLIISSDDITFSSTKLINNYLDVLPVKTRRYLENLKKKYSVEVIADKILSTKKMKILIVGDAIIDQYFYCAPLGKSSKEPIMVHRYTNEETFLGGTLATANHVAAYGADVTLLTVLGKRNSFESLIYKKLKKEVKPVFYFSENSNTIIKRRFLDAFTKQKLFQISYLDEELVNEKISEKIAAYLKDNIAKFNLVIVNDFGHGLLTEKIIRLITNKAKFLALNVQANSANYGFNIVTKYNKADYVCIDEAEIRLATHDQKGEIKNLMKKIYRKMKATSMIVTRGPFGSNGLFQDEGFIDSPSLTDKIVDRVGAGDALFALTAPLITANLPRDLAAFIGNVAGALQIQTVGNKKPIEFPDIIKFINRLLK